MSIFVVHILGEDSHLMLIPKILSPMLLKDSSPYLAATLFIEFLLKILPIGSKSSFPTIISLELYAFFSCTNMHDNILNV